MSAPSWMAHAACVDSDPNVFFPHRRDGIAAAVAICDRCPVRAECLAYAIERPSLTGVWGGTAATARAVIRARVDHARLHRVDA